MLYVAPVMRGASVGVICCPSFVWGFVLVLYFAPNVHRGFCMRYIMPKLCMGGGLLVLCVAPVVLGGLCWCYM